MQHGRLGVGIQALDQSLAQSFGLPDTNGALVGSVEKDSPAEKAGFKTGDVIRKIDGVAVIDSTDVTSRIGNTAPGTKLDVEVWRDGKAVELTATVGTLDDDKVAKAATKRDAEGQARRRRAAADARRRRRKSATTGSSSSKPAARRRRPASRRAT